MSDRTPEAGLDVSAIVAQAVAEVEAEERRAKIDAEKSRIKKARAARRWWHRLFPFRITITRIKS